MRYRIPPGHGRYKGSKSPTERTEELDRLRGIFRRMNEELSTLIAARHTIFEEINRLKREEYRMLTDDTDAP